MTLLVVLIVLIFLVGGWGFYGNYGGRRSGYGWGLPGGIVGLLVLILVLHLLGLF